MRKKEYIIRTDLAIQNKNLKKISDRKDENLEIKTFIKYNYNYTDIIFNNIESNYNKNKLLNAFINELKGYLDKYNLNKKNSVLVVGLGNINITCDSLGPSVIKRVNATSYYELLNINKKYRKIYTYMPGIIKDTGIMPFVGIKALINEIKPDFLIIIDSLLSSEVKYLNRVIQITDSGIIPGSGISNYQEEISFDTLGIPVIVIGVATAIEAVTIIKDALNIRNNKIDFKDGYDFVVSTKDIDLLINNISKIIGEGINKSLNNFSSF